MILAAQSKNSYCTEAKSFARQHHGSALLFSAVPKNTDPARDHWHRVDSPGEFASVARNGNSTAMATLRHGRLEYLQAVFQNQFGDSRLDVDYCFRPDGTLARLHSQLRSFHGDMIVVRDMSFDREGARLANRRQSFDLQTGKPRKIPGDFWDFPPPIFQTVGDLPFAKELQR